MPQNPVVRIIAFAALLLAVAVVVLAYTPWGQSLWQGKVAQEMGAAAIGGPFKLTDQNGKLRSDADFRGQYALVFFGYTNCPDVCPTTLQTLTDAMTALGPKADKVTPVFITVDPERDTPKMMKGYVENFGPTFIGLTGTSEQISQVARAYRVYFQKVPGKDGGPYLMDHSSIVYLLDRNGRFVTHFTHEAKAETIAQAVARQL